MYDTERFKHLIREASFEGWIENDGENCDWDHKTNLLKETLALKIVKEAHGEFREIVAEIERNSEPEDKIDGLYAKMVLKRLCAFEKRWFDAPKAMEEPTK